MVMVGSSGMERAQGTIFKRIKGKLRILAEESLGQCPETEGEGETQNQEPGCRQKLEEKSEWEVGSQGNNLRHSVQGLVL